MKTSIVKRLFERYLAQSLPTFQCHGHRIIEQPIGRMLKAFHFDSSAFSADAFYLHVFVQPLYVPNEDIMLTIGKRIVTGEVNIANEDEIGRLLHARVEREGLPFLRRHSTPLDLATILRPGRDVNLRLVKALSFLMAGRYAECDRELRSLQRDETAEIRRGTASPWEVVLLDRVNQLMNEINIGPDRGLTLLSGWEDYTRQQLRLPPREEPSSI